mmetsp:Transcript_24101/g.47307  ORF Transcript_24101/g.47307 Transcript_24101/m.47307 type:complete len:229 (-) Transcript_24101:630-1316(-)
MVLLSASRPACLSVGGPGGKRKVQTGVPDLASSDHVNLSSTVEGRSLNDACLVKCRGKPSTPRPKLSHRVPLSEQTRQQKPNQTSIQSLHLSLRIGEDDSLQGLHRRQSSVALHDCREGHVDLWECVVLGEVFQDLCLLSERLDIFGQPFLDKRVELQVVPLGYCPSDVEGLSVQILQTSQTSRHEKSEIRCETLRPSRNDECVQMQMGREHRSQMSEQIEEIHGLSG